MKANTLSATREIPSEIVADVADNLMRFHAEFDGESEFDIDRSASLSGVAPDAK